MALKPIIIDRVEKLKAYRKAYALAHAEKLKAYQKAHYRANVEKIKIRHRANAKIYYKANSLRERTRNKAYRKDNPEKIKTQVKLHYLTNIDKIKAYRITHRKEISSYQKKYYQKNIEQIKARNKAHYKANPEKALLHNRKRKALRLGNGYEPYMDRDIFERDNWTCQLCGKKIDQSLKWPHPQSKSIDHIVPLARGGNDSPTNVQATHLRCNVAKGKGRIAI